MSAADRTIGRCRLIAVNGDNVVLCYTPYLPDPRAWVTVSLAALRKMRKRGPWHARLLRHIERRTTA